MTFYKNLIVKLGILATLIAGLSIVGSGTPSPSACTDKCDEVNAICEARCRTTAACDRCEQDLAMCLAGCGN